MKKLLSIFALITAFAFGISEAKAQIAAKANNSALLYEITGKGLKKPSYLFGTIHLMCQKDLFPAEKLNGFFGQTEQLLLEINMSDQAEMQKAIQGMSLADGKSLKENLKPEEYTKLDEVFKNYIGVSFDRFQTFKPIMITTLLITSPKALGCQAAAGYDKTIMDMAIAGKLPIAGLETVEDEYAALDSQSLQEQIEGLNKVAADPEKSFAEFRKLYAVYLTQNSDEVYRTTEQQFKTDKMPQDTLLDNRNKNWIPAIEKNIAEKPTFIAVGAGHLGGKKGVVNLLRAKGYKLKPIKF